MDELKQKYRIRKPELEVVETDVAQFRSLTVVGNQRAFDAPENNELREMYENKISKLETALKEATASISEKDRELQYLKEAEIKEQKRHANEISKLTAEFDNLKTKYKDELSLYKKQLSKLEQSISNLEGKRKYLEEQLRESKSQQITEEMKKQWENYKMLAESVQEDLSLESAERGKVEFQLKALGESILSEKRNFKGKFKQFNADFQDTLNEINLSYQTILNAIPFDYNQK